MIGAGAQAYPILQPVIEYGFEKAIKLGYSVCLVEGNPKNYRSRGFVTSADHGITACEKINLPAIECLMVKELVPGKLRHMSGIISYDMYETLS